MKQETPSPVVPLAVALVMLSAAGILLIRLLPEAPLHARKSSACDRAARRAYDGAPPVIPHPPLGAACVSCHGDQAVRVPGVGLSPPMPHGKTSQPGRFKNCRQCHVFKESGTMFADSLFVALEQNLMRGDRLYPGAPPLIPHRLFLREDCQSCHAGPAVRDEIRCTHPERIRCTQCHVPARTGNRFGP